MKITSTVEESSQIGFGKPDHKKKKKVKALTVSKAKARAWKVFSQYIRLKACCEQDHIAKELVRCYTCGTIKQWKELQAGHGIAGRNNAVLFMEEIVKPQCVGCNIYGRGKSSIFTEKLIDELGMERYAELVRKSNEVVQYKVNDYLEIEKFYKHKLELLEIGGEK